MTMNVKICGGFGGYLAMYIDEMIEQLQMFRNEFGNLEVKVPEIIETSTRDSYSKNTNFNNCRVVVSHYEPLKLAVVIDKVIE